MTARGGKWCLSPPLALVVSHQSPTPVPGETAARPEEPTGARRRPEEPVGGRSRPWEAVGEAALSW